MGSMAVIYYPSCLLPNGPTFAEAGFTGSGFANPIWVGLLGPAEMDASIFDRIAEAVPASVREPSLKRYPDESAFVSIGNTSAEFGREYRAEVAFIPKLFHHLGMILG